MLFVAFLAVAVASQVSAVSHEAQPYEFGYSIKDKHGEQHREETSSGPGSVKGSYGFTDDRGIHRVVEYIADHNGFRAHVKTNEPGTAKENPAAVNMASSNNKIPAAPHAFNFGAAAQKAPMVNVVKHTNNAGFNHGFGGSLNLKEFGFPSELSVGLGEEMFNQGYGLGNDMEGFDGMGYGDLLGGNVGYKGMGGNLNRYYGNHFQGHSGVNANSFNFRGSANGGYGQGSANLGGSYMSGNGKYQTRLVGGSVNGFDNRYTNFGKDH